MSGMCGTDRLRELSCPVGAWIFFLPVNPGRRSCLACPGLACWWAFGPLALWCGAAPQHKRQCCAEAMGRQCSGNAEALMKKLIAKRTTPTRNVIARFNADLSEWQNIVAIADETHGNHCGFGGNPASCLPRLPVKRRGAALPAMNCPASLDTEGAKRRTGPPGFGYCLVSASSRLKSARQTAVMAAWSAGGREVSRGAGPVERNSPAALGSEA